MAGNSPIYESFAVLIVFVWLYQRFCGTIRVVVFVLLSVVQNKPKEYLLKLQIILFSGFRRDLRNQMGS